MGERRAAGDGFLRYSPNYWLVENPSLLVDMSDDVDCMMSFEIPRPNWIVEDTLYDHARALPEGPQEALQSAP